MASHGKAEEAKLQSQCVIWLWNNYPQTRGLFFQVENEGMRISSKALSEEILFIQKNITNPTQISLACRRVMEMCKFGNSIAGAQAKAMGLVSGVSDCLFMWKSKTYCFEFKTETGRQSENQVNWQNLIEKNNFEYILIRNFESFSSKIRLILDK